MNISAYMTSIRPYRWMSLYERLKKTELDFEIVIVGPTKPDFKQPEEIKFHFSEVKPSQCFHASASLCTGEMLLQVVDDIDYEPSVIENMYDVIKEADDKVMATASYFQNNRDYSPYQNVAGQADPEIPILPVCGMFPRSAFIEVQGFDKRFDGVMGELDLYMRLHVAGYRTQFVPGKVGESTKFQKKEGSSLCKKFWNKDRPKCIGLWQKDGKWTTTRTDIMRPYEDKDLLTVNQYYG